MFHFYNLNNVLSCHKYSATNDDGPYSFARAPIRYVIISMLRHGHFHHHLKVDWLFAFQTAQNQLFSHAFEKLLNDDLYNLDWFFLRNDVIMFRGHCHYYWFSIYDHLFQCCTYIVMRTVKWDRSYAIVLSRYFNLIPLYFCW